MILSLFHDFALNISQSKRKLHHMMKLFYIFDQDHLLVAPPGSEKHCRLESFIIRTIQKQKTFSHFSVQYKYTTFL